MVCAPLIIELPSTPEGKIAQIGSCFCNSDARDPGLALQHDDPPRHPASTLRIVNRSDTDTDQLTHHRGCRPATSVLPAVALSTVPKSLARRAGRRSNALSSRSSVMTRIVVSQQFGDFAPASIKQDQHACGGTRSSGQERKWTSGGSRSG
jgi:hypothetical protein